MPLVRIAVTGLIALAAVALALGGEMVGIPRLLALSIVVVGMGATMWRLGYVDAAITDTLSRIGTGFFFRIRK